MVSSAGAKVASDKMKHPFMTKSQPSSKEKEAAEAQSAEAQPHGEPCI